MGKILLMTNNNHRLLTLHLANCRVQKRVNPFPVIDHRRGSGLSVQIEYHLFQLVQFCF